MEAVSIILGVVGAAAGAGASYVLINKSNNSKAKSIIDNAEKEGERIKADKLLQAKEKFFQLKTEHEKVISERNQKAQQKENSLNQRENTINQKQNEIKKLEREVEVNREKLNAQLELVKKKESEVEKLHKRQVEQLEAMAGITADKAKEQLVEALKAEAKTNAMEFVQTSIEEAKITATKEAKKIIIQTIQRMSTEVAIDNAVSVFHIESDEIKGRIIGREGRNIRALEAATGVEIIVDDTPEAIIHSCFDPVRREFARLD